MGRVFERLFTALLRVLALKRAVWIYFAGYLEENALSHFTMLRSHRVYRGGIIYAQPVEAVKFAAIRPVQPEQNTDLIVGASSRFYSVDWSDVSANTDTDKQK